MPIMKAPLGVQDVIIKIDPNAIVQGMYSCVCFLVSQWICSICLAREGKEGYSIHLRVPGGDGEPLTLAMGAS